MIHGDLGILKKILQMNVAEISIKPNGHVELTRTIVIGWSEVQ